MKRGEIVFREELSKAFREAIQKKGLTVSAAAKTLGVSRQSLHSYLNQSRTPKSNVIHKACVKWCLSMNVFGKTFSAADFETPERAQHRKPVQLNFSEILKSLDNRNLQVKLIRVDEGTLELKLRIDFAS